MPTYTAIAPGRINLIGEHTDYNDGWVLPAAIDKTVRIALTPTGDDRIRIEAVSLRRTGHAEAPWHQPIAPRDDERWMNYALGVVELVRQRLHQLGRAPQPLGFEATYTGNVPIGAGLSSSAAVECAFAMALNEWFGLGMTRMDMALLAQQAEQVFSGVRCGLMDQFASLHGKASHAMLLDCRTHAFAYVPLEGLLRNHELLLCDSMVKHALAASAYNDRRAACEAGAAILAQHHPGVQALRDATPQMLAGCRAYMPPEVYAKCAYVVAENDRVLQAAEALRIGDYAALGALMSATHAGLSRDYEVSCPELDFMAEVAQGFPGVLGARMMGGGFGGCLLVLAQKPQAIPLLDKITQAYFAYSNIHARNYRVRVSDGARVQVD